MAMNNLRKILLGTALLLSLLKAYAQLPYKFVDGRKGNYCTACEKLIAEKPKEVGFGIQINTNGDIYFMMNNTQWFYKIFRGDSYGVTVDLVSKDRYTCSNSDLRNGAIVLPMGTMLFPVYKPELVKGINSMSEGNVFIKIGNVPKSLMNKQLEGNLVIMNGNNICFYTNFVNIDRSEWQLLPMGLFTDTLLQVTKINTNRQDDFFTYTKRLQLEVPFEKSSAGFSGNYLRTLYDSVELTKYSIRKIELRAYSSIEGPEKLNKELMKQRADTIIRALKNYQSALGQIKLITAENWMDFFKDIRQTKFSGLQDLSKSEIKQKLTDNVLLNELEPLLAKHRKGVLTIYLEAKSSAALITNTSILSDFNNAVTAKDISKARAIQRELVDRIRDNQLPLEYMNRLEVPQSKEFSALLNDREVYKYLLRASSEYEALDNFLVLKQLDPENGRINYNICALRFFMWQFGADTLAPKVLPAEIDALSKQGINAVLVKRMLINYHILKCEDNMRTFDYDGKDKSLDLIRTIYRNIVLNDEDIYSLAKYFAHYAHFDWSEEIIAPRIDKIDVSEDLVFYYVNLSFFSSASYDSEEFRKAALNAINLNNKRFCNFFLPNDKGGASMQLLGYGVMKKMYCEACK
ncbi:MAG: hypothetical protein ABIQ31_09125 [Ferruginibacter sp.]